MPLFWRSAVWDLRGFHRSCPAPVDRPWLHCSRLFSFFPSPYGRGPWFSSLFSGSGAWLATRGEQLLGRKDPGEIVIDELLGMWLVLLPFTRPGWGTIGLAFLLFRVFDMWKPWPVHASESWLPDGYGVMIDDVMAGLQALLVMGLLWIGDLLPSF